MHDIILLGMDFMTEAGMCVNAADEVAQWEENSVPLYLTKL